MEIFITGDTHGDFRRFRPDIFYEQEHMTKEDLVLICGDFGGIWHGDQRDDAGLDWLEVCPTPPPSCSEIMKTMTPI